MRRAARLLLLLALLHSGAGAQERYRVAGTEVTDARSGLVWRRCGAGQRLAGAHCEGTAAAAQWHEALAYAHAEAGRTGLAWRLPTLNEFAALGRADPGAFPGLEPGQWIWSATPVSGDAAHVWVNDFASGRSTTYPALGHDLGIRLVRSMR